MWFRIVNPSATSKGVPWRTFNPNGMEAWAQALATKEQVSFLISSLQAYKGL